jgi:HEAT repeat protein
MPKGFDAELAALESLRNGPPAETLEPVRRLLAHKNNFLVSKAARLVAEHNHASLIPDLVAAFDRFRADSNKNDPNCWAKEACAKSLAALEYQEPDLFLTGMTIFQPGFVEDAAASLRGICALALVQCRGLSNTQVLEHLIPLFTDKELPVRVNAARAVEQIGTESASLLLRLRAELGSGEPELLGACYSGVLRLDGPRALDWAAKFLHPLAPDDTSAEAAFAIADTRTEAAFRLLHSTWEQTLDAEFRGTLLTAIALTRQPAAWEFLLEEAAGGSRPAREALEASAPPAEILERLRNRTT